MGLFASKVKRPLSEIAIIDEEIIANIAGQVPGGLTINQIKSDSEISDAIEKKHASHSDDQDLNGKADVNHTHAGGSGGLTQSQIRRRIC
jgi:hypothetical protein